MKETHHLTLFKPLLIIVFLFIFNPLLAQGPTNSTNQPSNFWKNVQFGGGIGLGFSSGYTDVTISPSAIYNVNSTVAVGASLQFGFISAKNDYTSTLYGGSLIGLVNPIPEIQLSAELEEINVTTEYELDGGNRSNSLWNTALFLGAGYRTGNVTIGVRYDILFDNKYNGYYNEPFMPFVRVYF